MKKIYIILITLLILVGCSTKENPKKGSSTLDTGKSETNPVVTITMDTEDVLEIELYPSVAPNTVNNFISLVSKGYYDGLTFHRIIDGFMIQGGDPEGDGKGGPGYNIAGEFSSNGFENLLGHDRGVISMARANAPDSAGSQFFIMHADSPHLDEDYAAFGKVISDMSVIDTIVKQTDGIPTMKEVTVDTKGITYEEPVTE